VQLAGAQQMSPEIRHCTIILISFCSYILPLLCAGLARSLFRTDNTTFIHGEYLRVRWRNESGQPKMGGPEAGNLAWGSKKAMLRNPTQDPRHGSPMCVLL